MRQTRLPAQSAGTPAEGSWTMTTTALGDGGDRQHRAGRRRAVVPAWRAGAGDGALRGVPSAVHRASSRGDRGRPRRCRSGERGARRHRAAYLVTPSSERAQAQQERFVELAGKAGVKHLVGLSQLGADASPVRFLRYHAAVERRSGSSASSSRSDARNFFQGLLALSGPIREQGLVARAIGDARVSAIDVATSPPSPPQRSTEPGHAGATYTLTGPAAVTHARSPTPSGRQPAHGGVRRRPARDLRDDPARAVT